MLGQRVYKLSTKFVQTYTHLRILCMRICPYTCIYHKKGQTVCLESKLGGKDNFRGGVMHLSSRIQKSGESPKVLFLFPLSSLPLPPSPLPLGKAEYKLPANSQE